MKKRVKPALDRWGLLANGSSARWYLAVDECFDREEWALEIDGSQFYLLVQLRDLKVLAKALEYLRAGHQPRHRADGPERLAERPPLVLGRFGAATVSLLWDDEDVPRCFLLIEPKSRCTMRVSLDAADIQMWIEALRQVLKQLPQPAAK